MQKAISIFTNSAGSLLLAVASALFLINLTSPAHSVPPRDPIFFIAFSDLFWIVAGIALVMALVCFFTERLILTIFLLACLATSFWTCRIILFWNGCHSLTGYLGGFSYAFGISAKIANAIANVVFAYLFMGSYGVPAFKWLTRPKIIRPRPSVHAAIELKVSCVNPSCRQHIVVDQSRFGREIQCPACGSILDVPVIFAKS